MNKVKVSDLSVNRNPVNGSIVVSAIVAGYLTAVAYYGYNKRAAMKLFRDEMSKRHA